MKGSSQDAPMDGYWPSALSLEQQAIMGSAPCGNPSPTDIGLIDVHQAFREAVSLETRRAFGAFFTPANLARSLVAQAQPTKQWFDPTCGAGDLLLAAADTLPLHSTLGDTLSHWSDVLAGADLHEPLVRTAKARLVIRA